MFPYLDAELARSGHSGDYVARELGMTRQEYEALRDLGSFRLSEAVALSAMCDKPVEHLFQPAGGARDRGARDRGARERGARERGARERGAKFPGGP
jgi:hypothetical protein